MSAQLKQFVEHILRITPQYIDIFGNGVPGMTGRSAATAAAANAGTDTTQQLHHAVLEFARAYNDPASDDGALAAQAADIEGLLMVAVTLGVLAAKDADQRADELHDLMAGRREATGP